MKQDYREKLIAALRSGDYAQGQEVLRQKQEHRDEPDQFCCLGVLCDLLPKDFFQWGSTRIHATAGKARVVYNPSQDHPFDFNCEIPGMRILREVDMAECDANALAEANDRGDSFKAIADAIEQGKFNHPFRDETKEEEG